MNTQGGSYVLGATLAEAGVMGQASGGSYTLSEGFWYNLGRLITTDAHVPEAETSTRFVNALHRNFPNPFGGTTQIVYSVAQASPVKLEIFDVAGRRVREIVSRNQIPGRYVVDWAGSDGSGEITASGVYFYRLTVGDWSKTQKMVKFK